MTLSGGDPAAMGLRQFIDAAAACLVDEYRRLGIDLVTALEKVAALGMPAHEAAVAANEAEAAGNAQAVQALQAMMSGVKGAPV